MYTELLVKRLLFLLDLYEIRIFSTELLGPTLQTPNTATSHLVTPRSLTLKARIQSQLSPLGFFLWKKWHWPVFFRALCFPCKKKIISQMFQRLSPSVYILSKGQRLWTDAYNLKGNEENFHQNGQVFTIFMEGFIAYFANNTKQLLTFCVGVKCSSWI
jgi:hypothetical protein